MKGERKLSLVTPASGAGEPAAPEPPFSEEELGAAGALRDALERGDDPLALALRAAAMPGDLDAGDHDALLERALGGHGSAGSDAPATEAERRAAERLRDVMDRPGEPAGAAREQAELAEALRAAWRPAPLAEIRNEALIARALRRTRDKHRRIAPLTMAALSTVAAIAAGVALILGQARDAGESARAPTAPAAPAETAAATPAMIRARSTTELFDATTPFPREGGQTARIDRIAQARSADLRANRYAAWGVR